MEKLPMNVRIEIDYFKNLKNQNYALTKIFIMKKYINYKK